ncbi:MAG: TonB family protein [Acidobacteriota bacterium]
MAGACRKGGPAAPSPAAPPDDRGVVTLERVPARADAAPKAPQVVMLPRGTELKVLESRGDAVHVVADRRELWIPAGSFERRPDREAREKRAEAVAGFTRQPARAVESCPVFLAPDYGAARWGTLEDGDDVDVVLSDHDFFGVRLVGKMLAFVPARSVRLLPSAVSAGPAGPAGRGVFPEVQSLGVPDRDIRPTPGGRVPDTATFAGAAPSASPTLAAAILPQEPLASLPDGAELPVLVSRLDARYPDAARRMNLTGDVVLRIVVEGTGSVGRIDVLTAQPAGMTEAAVDAVRRWTYRPARVHGQPVAVWKVIRIRFSRTVEKEPPPD